MHFSMAANSMDLNKPDSYNIFGSGGILLKHQCPMRGSEFVTRKITDSVVTIKIGQLDCLERGNLDAKRDWGFAKEYVVGMWRMLLVDEPDTFLLGTNRTGTVRDFVRMAYKGAGIEVDCKSKEDQETAVVTATGKTVMHINPKFFRPAEVALLIGDSAKAKAKMGWLPKTISEQLCQMMVEADLRRNQARFSF
jgi:GDPmannose 4,6-dehydratase